MDNQTIKIGIRQLNAWFGMKQVLQNIDMNIQANKITAVIGPSGCGKSTFIRCINRMHETIINAKMTGEIKMGDVLISDEATSSVDIRRKIGMVFQKPTPFPTMSIYNNVVVGLRLTGVKKKATLDEVVESSLKDATLWQEVKDILHEPGIS